jgi:hypothetical protein
VTLVLALSAYGVWNVVRFAAIAAMAVGAFVAGRPGHPVERP